MFKEGQLFEAIKVEIDDSLKNNLNANANGLSIELSLDSPISSDNNPKDKEAAEIPGSKGWNLTFEELSRKYNEICSSKPRSLMNKISSFLLCEDIHFLDAKHCFPQFAESELETIKSYQTQKRIKDQFTSEEDKFVLGWSGNLKDAPELLKHLPNRCLKEVKYRYNFLRNSNQSNLDKSKHSASLSNILSEDLRAYQVIDSLYNIMSKLSNQSPVLKDSIRECIDQNISNDQKFAEIFNNLLELLIKMVECNMKPYIECKLIVENLKVSFQGTESLCYNKFKRILQRLERPVIRKRDSNYLIRSIATQLNLMSKLKLNLISAVDQLFCAFDSKYKVKVFD